MQPVIDHFTSNGGPLPLELFLPKTVAGRCPAVLVLHGSFGLLPPYREDIVSFAQALAARGIAAALPHYLDATGTAPGLGVLPLIATKRPAWRQACSDALAALAQDVRLDATRLGLLGFSLGGNLALSLALAPPAGVRPCCVVDFFGPSMGLDSGWAGLPPALIVHGTADELVPPSESAQVVQRLEAAGKKQGRDFWFTSYPGAGHGFHGPDLTRSRDETVAFVLKAI